MKRTTNVYVLRIAGVALGLAAFMTAFTAAADPAKPAATTVMRSVQVALPAGSTAFPSAPGSELANQHCVICHSAGMVLRQPPLSFDDWKAEVAKMRAVYGAPMPAENIEALARYLTSINGKP